MARYNIRMSGIGGQGVITASHVLSNGVIFSGGESTLVPFFGSEKRMAPVESYVRVATERIYEIGEIIYPNVIMIFHPQVITHGKSYTMPFYAGLKPDGVILINSNEPLPFDPDEQREINENRAQVFFVPATRIAVEKAGTELATNMAMVGAIAGTLGLPDMDSLEKSVKDRFLGGSFVTSGGTASLDSVMEKKFAKKAELVEKNIDVVRTAYNYAMEHGWTKGALESAVAAR
jgi:pyruvate ferredoxin oxidoreductase gamma subunit